VAAIDNGAVICRCQPLDFRFEVSHRLETQFTSPQYSPSVDGLRGSLRSNPSDDSADHRPKHHVIGKLRKERKRPNRMERLTDQENVQNGD
jgi:hypothetical protein